MYNQSCSSGQPETATNCPSQVSSLCTLTAVIDGCVRLYVSPHWGCAGHLTTDAVVASSADIMQTTMDYMTQKWGSAAGYAQAIGITSTEISRIRMNFRKRQHPKT